MIKFYFDADDNLYVQFTCEIAVEKDTLVAVQLKPADVKVLKAILEQHDQDK